MKNIHVIPTEKPSRLVIDTIENKLYYQPILHNKTVNVLTQDIYITSSEEIKKGDYFYLCDADIIAKYVSVKPVGEGNKIILTTDVDLIADGVQAIDDEFLQWFVKNLSCEEVVVKKGKMKLNDDGEEYGFPDMSLYKIIIPIEEPEEETIEQAAKRELEYIHETARGFDFDLGFKTGMVRGAEWQEGRKYSKEDVDRLIDVLI